MYDKEKDFLLKIPKIELHLHLEGAGRKNTIKELSSRENSYITADSIGKIDKYQGLPHFIQTMRSLMDICLKKPEDYERIAFELFEDLAKQNVIYAEVSFDPIRGLRLGIPYDEMLSAVYNAKKSAEEKYDIKIGLIIGLGREFGKETVTDFTKKACDSKKYGVVGLDLHGNEASNPPEIFIEAFNIARSAELGLRAHAGEGSGPQSVWAAIGLGVSRIAHGIRAIEDPLLFEYLKGKKITLDMCPTSNYKLGIVNSLSEHPLRSFFNNGIPVTISTDDPFFFNTSITKEYEILKNYLNFTNDELLEITLYAAEAAFLTAEAKVKLKEKILKLS